MTVLVTGGAGYIGGHMVLGLKDAGEKVVVIDNLSTGFAWAIPDGVEMIVGDFGDADLGCAGHRRTRRRRDRAFRRQDRRAGIRDRSARLLSQQHRQRSDPARMRGEARDQTFHLFLDRRGLWRDGIGAGHGDDAARADLAVWALQADGRADTGGHRARTRSALCGVALFQRCRRRSEGPARAVRQERDAFDQGRRADGVGPADFDEHFRRSTIRPEMAPASATSSM